MFASFLEKRAIRDPAWNAWGAGQDIHDGNTAAGQTVNTSSAMKLLAVYGSMSLIADLISQLPIDHYRKQGKLRTDVQPRAAWLDQPNPELDGQECIGQFIAALLSAGNSYEIVLRSATGQVGEIWPQDPNDVQRVREVPGGPIVTYIRGQQFRGELLHTRGFTLPGQILGCNPITYARESIGVGLALQEYGARFYSNGSVPGVIVEAPGGPDTIDAEKMRESFEQFHKGTSKAHGVAVLTGGATAKALAISPADAQFLEGRNFSAAEIATTLFRIPPDLIGVVLQGSKDVTYQNIEQRWTELRRRCLGFWITKYERSRSSLMPKPQYARLNDDAYLRADIKTRYESYQIAIASKIMVPNEARAFEDWEPLPGGDKFTEPPAPVAPVQVPVPVKNEPARELERPAEIRLTASDRMMLEEIAGRSVPETHVSMVQPVPVVNVDNHLPEQPAPIVNVEAARAADVNVQLPEERLKRRVVIRDDKGTVIGFDEEWIDG